MRFQKHKMIEAIYMAHDINQTIIEFIDKIVAEVGKEKHTYVSCAVPAEMFEAMKQIVYSRRDGSCCIYR